MSIYTYHVKDAQGFNLTGVLEAPVVNDVVSKLRKKNLIIISIKEVQVEKVKEKTVRLEDLVIFSRQFATMIDAGIVMVHALQILENQTKNKVLAVVIIDIRDQILNGSSLHEAMAKYPKVFTPLFVSLVRAGEISGLLDETLERAAIYLEKTNSLRRKVRTAMVYPVTVIIMAFTITSVLLIKVVPTFENIFYALGGTLPLPTRILLLVSAIVRKFFLFGLVVIGFAAAGFKNYIKTAKGRYKFDSILFKLPIFGDLFQKVAMAKFARTLSTLTKSAIPIIQALEIVGKTSGNVLVEEALENASKAISHGESIAEPLSRSRVFPAMVVGMIAVGEQTGELEKMLCKIADMYEDEVDAVVNGLAAMIEPVVIGILGIIIGGIVVSLFLPVFKITELIR